MPWVSKVSTLYIGEPDEPRNDLFVVVRVCPGSSFLQIIEATTHFWCSSLYFRTPTPLEQPGAQ